MNKYEAQPHSDRIRAFRQGLQVLEDEGVITLAADARARFQAYHAGLLREQESD